MFAGLLKDWILVPNTCLRRSDTLLHLLWVPTHRWHVVTHRHSYKHKCFLKGPHPTVMSFVFTLGSTGFNQGCLCEPHTELSWGLVYSPVVSH